MRNAGSYALDYWLMHTCLSVCHGAVTNSGLMDVPVRYIPTAVTHVRYLVGKSTTEQSTLIFFILFFSDFKLTPRSHDQEHHYEITYFLLLC
jgi:hypothetical protein